MTPAELDAFIDRWMNSAIDAFTNRRIITVLKNLSTSGITDTFATYDQFEERILANRAAGRDWYIRARVNATGYIYEYFPDTQEINWTASQKIKTI